MDKKQTNGEDEVKKAEYKIITSENGLPELEKKVSKLLNTGWKPIGGIAFNHGYPYQALARVVTVRQQQPPPEPDNKRSQYRSATEAMRMVDDLT